MFKVLCFENNFDSLAPESLNYFETVGTVGVIVLEFFATLVAFHSATLSR